MSDADFTSLAALWSSPAAEEEDFELEELIRRTPRLARREMVGELVAGSVLAVAIGLAVVFRLGLATLLMGSLILLILAWSSWKRHRLGHLALLIDRQDRAAFFSSSIAAKQAELKRSAIDVALLLPGTFLTMLLLFTLHDNGAGGAVLPFIASLFTTPRGLVATLLLAAAVHVYVSSHLRLRRELDRLHELQDLYREERLKDRSDG